MMRNVIYLIVLILFCSWAAIPVFSASIPIENASFESPAIDLINNPFGAVPNVNGWTEIDNAPLGDSVNTGVFVNTEPNSSDHIVNADGNQLAFLGSQAGNALEQDLEAVYKAGCDYRLTVAVCVSNRAPASDPLDVVLYYRDVNDLNNPVDIATKTVEPTGLSSTLLQDFSVWLPTVNSGDAWAGKTIGVAIRASGAPDIAGGFWDLDYVRLIESPPDPEAVLTVKE
jgi:hypothetical protein